MIVAVNGAEFLPYLGVWNRMIHADTFVVTDVTRFRNRHYENRNRVRTFDGWAWFSAPVNKNQNALIRDITLRPFHEVSRSWAIVESNYRGRAEYWDTYAPAILEALRQDCLLTANLSLMNLIKGWLGIGTQIIRASEVSSLVLEDRLSLSVSLVEELGADAYLTSAGGIGMIPQRFADKNIKFMFQEFVSIPYPQIHPGWQPRMSILDCLLTHGAEYTFEVAQRGWIPEGLTMTDIVVKSTESNEELQERVTKALGGSAPVTERQGGDRIVKLNPEQANKLNRMKLEDRNSALGGNVRQILND